MAKRWYYKDADGNKVPVPQYKINADDYYTKTMSDSRYYEKSATDTLLTDKVSKSDIVQSTGTSETAVMSQKSITDELNKKIGNGVLAQTTDIASGAITGPKIAENSITTSNIVDGTIQSTDINSNAFDSTLKNASKLADAKAVGDAIAVEETRAKEAEENLVGKATELGMIINEIADASIQPPVEGKNLFNVATIKDGYNVSDSGGEFANENHSISEYISISGTTNIVVSANANIRNDIKFALYDASKTTIVGSVLRITDMTLDSSTTRYYYTIVTNGAAYIRFSAATAYFQ